MMANLAARINDDRTAMNRKRKPKNNLLFDLQMKYKELYDEINKIISGKKDLSEHYSADAIISQHVL